MLFRSSLVRRPSSVVRFVSYSDHRVAMMEAIAGLVLGQPIEIDDIDCVKTSFPDFFDLLSKLEGSREGD